MTGIGASRVMCHSGSLFAESRALVSKIQNFFGPNNLFSRLTDLSVTRHRSGCNEIFLILKAEGHRMLLPIL